MTGILLIVLGVLAGTVVGAAICIRYLKEEMIGRVGPRMDLLHMKVDNMQSSVDLALANWHSELHRHTPHASLGPCGRPARVPHPPEDDG